MRILHYLQRMRLEDGGVVRAVLDLCGAMAQHGHDVRILTFDAFDAPEPWQRGDDGMPRIVALGPRSGPLARLSREAAAAALRQIESADVLHLHVPWDVVCLQLGGLARRAGVPYVVGVHGMLDDWCMAQKGLKKRLFLALAGRRFLERAGAVHVTAEAEGVQSSKWYPRGRPAVLPLIFDLEQYRTLPGPSAARRKFESALGDNGQATVLFLSRLHPKKGVELLIEAAARLRDDGVPVRVLIAGTGTPQYEQALRELARSRDVADRVAFLGFVSGVEKISLYEAADLFVLPTSQENWGFVLVEALACGTPVITTRGVDIWSELQESGGALIVDQAAPAIATAVGELLADEPKRAQMRAKARAWALENLDPAKVIARYERLYESLSMGDA